MTTKERILEESIKLFSINGYDAVSIRTIADAVGIGNSALYKHFASKQAIFDAIVEKCKAHFMDTCAYVQDSMANDINTFISMCLSMFEFQIQDAWIVMFRRILLIEQFKNNNMAHTFKEFFIDYPIQSQTLIFKDLMSQNLIAKKNPEVLAIELYAPFFMYHSINFDKDEVMKLLKVHVEYFYNENIKVGEHHE